MATTTNQDARTYLTFNLERELFAVDVKDVREVLHSTSITRVPRTPDFMRGVINLRGSVVPVVDLRLKFGMERSEDTVDTCVIVTELDMDGDRAVIGALADSVREVFQLRADEIEPPPRLGSRLTTDFIKGMGKRDGEFIILLDTNRIFSAQELQMVETLVNGTEPNGAVPSTA